MRGCATPPGVPRARLPQNRTAASGARTSAARPRLEFTSGRRLLSLSPLAHLGRPRPPLAPYLLRSSPHLPARLPSALYVDVPLSSALFQTVLYVALCHCSALYGPVVTLYLSFLTPCLPLIFVLILFLSLSSSSFVMPCFSF